MIWLGMVVVSLLITSCGDQVTEHDHQDFDLFEDSFVLPFACQKATTAQIRLVNQGNAKRNAFLKQCAQATSNSRWCHQVIRPNPASIATFRCTYGNNQAHQLIHPTTSTWKHAINAIKILRELEQKGFTVTLIYNWWRPEPYNKNVGGASGRHPFATSVDVRFGSPAEANRAFDELCRYRRQGRIRALGHYGTDAVHMGVGDSNGNTWGRNCP